MSKTNLQSKILSTVVIFFAFFALAGEVRAATYYVDATNGNDSWIGTAGARQNTTTIGPWKTIAKVNGFNFQPGDDVYFKCDGVWTDAFLNIDWSGTGDAESSRAVIGAYYGDGVPGVSGNKPVFNGGLNIVGTWSASHPTFQSYDGLVTIRTRSYVTVRNLNVTQSGGRGIGVFSSNFVNVEDCDVTKSFMDQILFEDSNDFRIVRNNTDLGPMQRLLTGWQGGAISSVASKGKNYYRGYVAYNNINRSHGEGLDLIKGGIDITAEYNVIKNSRSPIVYISDGMKNVTFRYNLVYSPSIPAQSPWWPNAGEYNAGISINDECPSTRNGYSSNINVYGNVIALNGNPNYSGYNLSIHATGDGFAGCPVDPCVHYGHNIYNNLFVNGSNYNIKIDSDCAYSSPSNIKNNIFLCTGEYGCSTANSIVLPKPNLNWSNNLFFGGAIDADGKNPSDAAYPGYDRNPLLSRSTGWTRTALASDPLDGSETVLNPSSPAIDKGANLGLPYNLDFFGTTRPQGAGWDIGAHEYTAGDAQAPGVPGGLSVR